VRYRDIVLTVSDETQGFPTRLPRGVYERLRRAAFDHRVPMNVVVVTALDRFLDDPEMGRALAEAEHAKQASRGET
jgi:hypothetical protein